VHGFSHATPLGERGFLVSRMILVPTVIVQTDTVATQVALTISVLNPTDNATVFVYVSFL
jgi:hypothetical protein